MHLFKIYAALHDLLRTLLNLTTDFSSELTPFQSLSAQFPTCFCRSLLRVSIRRFLFSPFSERFFRSTSEHLMNYAPVGILRLFVTPFDS